MTDSKKQGKAAAKELRRIHAIGRKILKVCPAEANLNAATIEEMSREHHISDQEVRQYRAFARRCSSDELTKLCQLCEQYDWQPSFTTTITKLMTLEDKKVRLAVTKLAAKEDWSLTRLQSEVFQRQGRLRAWGGRRPRVPATPEAMIVELESMCLRWRRLHQQLVQKPESDNKQLILSDLPAGIRASFIKAVRAIDELETAIDCRRKNRS